MGLPLRISYKVGKDGNIAFPIDPILIEKTEDGIKSRYKE